MRTVTALLLLVFSLTLSSCGKKSLAGLGGQAVLKLYAKHHSAPIDSITFYIKFNATDAPSNNQYDLVQKAVVYGTGNSYATVSGLKKGDYYVYAYGWDPSISEAVSGGIPYVISSETEQNVTVPVTE